MVSTGSTCWPPDRRRSTRPAWSTPTRCGRCCHRAAQRYDLVIVNTPPFATADGLAMARLTDRAVVVLAKQETRGVLGDSLATLRVARVQVLGLVVST